MGVTRTQLFEVETQSRLMESVGTNIEIQNLKTQMEKKMEELKHIMRQKLVKCVLISMH